MIIQRGKSLGTRLYKAIRFPLMSNEEFASIVIDCNILTLKEVGELVKYYADVPLPSLISFPHSPRIGHSSAVSDLENSFLWRKVAGITIAPLTKFASEQTRMSYFMEFNILAVKKVNMRFPSALTSPVSLAVVFLRCRALRRDIPKAAVKNIITRPVKNIPDILTSPKLQDVPFS